MAKNSVFEPKIPIFLAKFGGTPPPHLQGKNCATIFVELGGTPAPPLYGKNQYLKGSQQLETTFNDVSKVKNFGSFRLSLWMDGSYLLDFYDCCPKNAQILSLLILLNDLPSPPDSGTKIFFLAFVSEPLDLAFYRTLHFFCFLHFIHFAALSFLQIHFFAIGMILQICLAFC